MHLTIDIWPFSDSSNLKALFSQVQFLKSVSLIALSLFISSFAGLCFQGLFFVCGRRGGVMANELDSGSSGPCSSPGRGHCVVFLGKKLYSHSASLHPGL